MPRILLVEDNELNRDMLSRRLQRQGFEVRVAADGLQGLEAADHIVPDLVLMDVVLPGMNGFQATRALSRDGLTRDIPVLIVSTKSMETDRAWGLRQGARDYIVKPPDEGALVARINELVGA